MVQPGFAAVVEGRDAAIDSFRDFSAAQVHGYTEEEISVRAWGDTAVATIRFEIDWETGGERHEEHGHEILVFGRDKDRWRCVWRHVLIDGQDRT